MLTKLAHISTLIMTVLLGLSGEMIPVASAQTSAPSLEDGIMCMARGRTNQGSIIYAYTSMIDNASLKNKQPVSVTLVSPISEVFDGQVIVVDKKSQRIVLEHFEGVTPPQMQPIGNAMTTYTNNNTFEGMTGAGTPVSFSLENKLRTFNLKHGNETYTGVCY